MDSSGLEGLVRIEPAFVEQASITCARAFEDDSITQWLIPDKTKRANIRYAFEVPLNMANLGFGEAYATSERCEGVAIWMPSNQKQSIAASLEAGYPFLPLRCGWRYFLRDARMIRHCDKMRDKYAPPLHMYLGLLAVSPEHQGKGYAGRLLRPMLKQLDESKLACYLETQNLKNVAMYRRFGFEQVHETTMPGSDIKLHLMLRQSRINI